MTGEVFGVPLREDLPPEPGTPFRILVTGSRTWPPSRRDAIWAAIEAAAGECRASSLTVVHGGAQGADAMAGAWCARHPMFGAVFVVEEIRRAPWGSHGKAAGLWRNRRMVDAGASVCIAAIMPCAFDQCEGKPAHGTHGGTHCADFAARAGIEVRRLTP